MSGWLPRRLRRRLCVALSRGMVWVRSVDDDAASAGPRGPGLGSRRPPVCVCVCVCVCVRACVRVCVFV